MSKNNGESEMIAPYKQKHIEERLKELLSRLESYSKNGLKEEQWAWGQCIKEVKTLMEKQNEH